ncbi:hypothetical protein TcasGA2_TC012339 [Tribolium castaneum]|uniref:Uncharacterized protein n=1 Tax=Tribolium castaneum TaxID=7070 RepID=D6X1R8_TRICA|nr:hypothetical protein TcasGA2_TC012339 [Tribolium castaneum]
MLNDKPRKKVAKRKFYSVPNLPTNERQGKQNEMLVVTPEDLKKLRKNLDKSKGEAIKPKPTKASSKKLSAKELNELLMTPAKSKPDNEPKTEDYQWLVKKNIIELIDAAKKKTEKITESKAQNLPKTKSENVKRRPVPKTKSEEQKPRTKELKHELLLKKTNTLNLPRRAANFPKEKTSSMHYHPSFVNRPPTTLLHPVTDRKKTGMAKLKELFRVFKTGQEGPPKARRSKRLEKVFEPRASQQPTQKKPVKKSNKIPEKVSKKSKQTKVEESSSVVKSDPDKKTIGGNSLTVRRRRNRTSGSKMLTGIGV